MVRASGNTPDPDTHLVRLISVYAPNLAVRYREPRAPAPGDALDVVFHHVNAPKDAGCMAK